MYDTISKMDGDCALHVPCSLVQIVRVVIVRVILVGVHGVMIVVLIGHDEVLVIYVAIFCCDFL